MKLRVYAHDKCSTCRQALKFLAGCGIPFDTVPIREQPPTKAELKRMLVIQGGNLRKLFNTSGLDYRTLKLSERLPKLTEAEALDLLAANGNLVKRPFVTGDGVVLVGFKEDEWRQSLG